MRADGLADVGQRIRRHLEGALRSDEPSFLLGDVFSVAVFHKIIVSEYR